jgi:murein DD-endopeptidase MepM/ murein hydrolase activator NlpD
VLPCAFPVGGWYGFDPQYPGNSAGFHYGVDVLAPSGTPLRAPADCTVIMAEFGPFGITGVLNRGWGNYVRFQLPDGTVLDYCHLSQFAPGIGSGVAVEEGQIIGYSGATGVPGVTVFGPHLHIQAWESMAKTALGSNRIDPAPLFWVNQ